MTVKSFIVQAPGKNGLTINCSSLEKEWASLLIVYFYEIDSSSQSD